MATQCFHGTVRRNRALSPASRVGVTICLRSRRDLAVLSLGLPDRANRDRIHGPDVRWDCGRQTDVPTGLREVCPLSDRGRSNERCLEVTSITPANPDLSWDNRRYLTCTCRGRWPIARQIAELSFPWR